MSKRAEYQNSIRQHEKAEQDFQSALARQFGPKACRWEIPSKLYNASTRVAYEAKRAASLAQSQAFNEVA